MLFNMRKGPKREDRVFGYWLGFGGSVVAVLVAVTVFVAVSSVHSQSGIARTAPEVLQDIHDQRPGWCTDIETTDGTAHLNSLYQKNASTWAAQCQSEGTYKGQPYTSWECVLVNNRSLSLSSRFGQEYC